MEKIFFSVNNVFFFSKNFLLLFLSSLFLIRC